MEAITDYPQAFSSGYSSGEEESLFNYAPAAFNISNTTTALPSSNLSIAEQAAGHLIYKIGFGIHMYWIPVIALIGICGNTLALIVMLQKHNRQLSCCLYMACLAVSDNMALLIITYYWTKPTFKIPLFHHLECSILGYLIIASAQYGMFIIVAMTVDRFITVRFSLSKARQSHCTPKRTVIMAGILLIVTLIFNIPHLVLLDSGVNYTCITFSGDSVWVKVYALLSIVINALIPFISLLTMNIIIIKTIKNASKKFTNSTECCRIKGTQCNITNNSSNQNDKEQLQLTITLLLVNFVFLVLTMPVYVRYIVYTIVNYKTDPAVMATYVLVYHITHKLYYTNNAVNFFLYCIGGSKFRRELKQLFVGIKESVSPSHSINTDSTASSGV